MWNWEIVISDLSVVSRLLTLGSKLVKHRVLIVSKMRMLSNPSTNLRLTFVWSSRGDHGTIRLQNVRVTKIQLKWEMMLTWWTQSTQLRRGAGRQFIMWPRLHFISPHIQPPGYLGLLSTATARKVKRKVYFVVVEKSGTPAAHSALYSMNISIPNLSRNCFLYDHQPWLYTEIVPTMDPNSAREWQYPNIRIFYRDFSIFLPRTISSLFIHIKESITAVHQHQAPGHRPSSSQKISLKCSL